MNVQLWYAWTTDAKVQLAYQRIDCLDDDERRQALRFRRTIDRDLYVLAHVMQRQVLAQSLGCSPQQLRFQRRPGGKPALHEDPLHFNLSHTRGAVLVGVGDRPLGVDIEAEDRRANLGVAKRFFAAPEYERLASLPQQQQRDAFFEIWTLKEAWLKAVGSGLAAPLDAFVVHPQPEGAAEVEYLKGVGRQGRCLTGRMQGPLQSFRWSLAVLQTTDNPGPATRAPLLTTPLQSWPEAVDT